MSALTGTMKRHVGRGGQAPLEVVVGKELAELWEGRRRDPEGGSGLDEGTSMWVADRSCSRLTVWLSASMVCGSHWTSSWLAAVRVVVRGVRAWIVAVLLGSCVVAGPWPAASSWVLRDDAA